MLRRHLQGEDSFVEFVQRANALDAQGLVHSLYLPAHCHRTNMRWQTDGPRSPDFRNFFKFIISILFDSSKAQQRQAFLNFF
jgi:hypothetical protein